MLAGPRRNPSELGPQRVVVLGMGAVALLLLGLGLFGFMHYEPVGQRSGLQVRIAGVYPIDPATGQLVGGAAATYRPEQPLGADVDWSSVPPDLVVAARWYDAVGTPVGGTGPARAADLPRRSVVGTTVEASGRPNPPGTYVFAVERWSGGRAVEVLGRQAALVVNG